jgi:hypothetical protein
MIRIGGEGQQDLIGHAGSAVKGSFFSQVFDEIVPADGAVVELSAGEISDRHTGHVAIDTLMAAATIWVDG